MAPINYSLPTVTENTGLQQSIVCNWTVNGRLYQVYEQPSNNINTKGAFTCNDVADPSGAAMYIIVTVSVFATAIGFFIGMTAFKKNKYNEWDKQAGEYLHFMYERTGNDIRGRLRPMRQQEAPSLGLVAYLGGIQVQSPGETEPTNTTNQDNEPLINPTDPNEAHNRPASLPTVLENDGDDMDSESVWRQNES